MVGTSPIGMPPLRTHSASQSSASLVQGADGFIRPVMVVACAAPRNPSKLRPFCRLRRSLVFEQRIAALVAALGFRVQGLAKGGRYLEAAKLELPCSLAAWQRGW